jgi:hypothetical protein
LNPFPRARSKENLENVEMLITLPGKPANRVIVGYIKCPTPHMREKQINLVVRVKTG